MTTPQNRAPKVSSVLLCLCCIHAFFSCAVRLVAGQTSKPVFACDVDSDPSLAAFGFCNTSLGVEARVADLVQRLTLQEKVAFLVNNASNVDRLGIPKYEWWSEAPHRVSYVGPGTKFSSLVHRATRFPQVILTAASFNGTLLEAIGKVVSTEARAMHNVGLAGLTFWSSNVNIFRDPRWGQGQETPGEDPLLSSKYASAYVRGLQQGDDGNADRLKVAACCKHFTVDQHRYHFNAEVVSTEARAMHNVGLAGLTFWSSNVNIFRDPRWGQGQETPGGDPLLSSKYVSAYVRGLQQSDDGNADQLKVAACCKHYTTDHIDNWKDVHRYHSNAEITQQDLEDTFQPPFKSCVLDGNVASVMCSYNQVNGKPTCADPALLMGIIRGKWNLNGYIVSDCDSMDVFYSSQRYTKTPEEAAAKAILAGLDLNCGSFLGQHAEAAVKGGLLNESAIDKAISNNFATLMRLGFFDGDPRKQLYGKLGPDDVCTPSNQELAREAARQGIVLLKNTEGSLPLSLTTIKSLAVIGPNANVTKTMIGNSKGTPCKYVTPLQGLAAVVSTIYVAGCADVGCGTAQTNDAKKAAASVDATVLVMGADQSIERESLDRVDLHLPGQQSLLVSEVANVSKGPVILVIMSGGGMDVSFAKDNDKITSILGVGYPGEAGGAAMADVIFGNHNPSGRLPMTWYPQSYADAVPMTSMNIRSDPATGYPGRTYRFYSGHTVYSFGDGLSYSHFSYGLDHAPQLVSVPLEEGHVCRSSACESLEATGEKCLNLTFDVHLSVKNVGNFGGNHTMLLFISPPAGHGSPQKHLLGFEKVSLASQSETRVHFRVDVCEDFSIIDKLGHWRVALGKYVLHVGNLKHELMVQV